MTTTTLITAAESRDVRIGRVVAALCQLHGIQHQQFAERIAMPATTLSNKIKGQRPWRTDELDRIAAALGVPVSLLLQEPETLIDSLAAPTRSTNYRSA